MKFMGSIEILLVNLEIALIESFLTLKFPQITVCLMKNAILLDTVYLS